MKKLFLIAVLFATSARAEHGFQVTAADEQLGLHAILFAHEKRQVLLGGSVTDVTSDSAGRIRLKTFDARVRFRLAPTKLQPFVEIGGGVVAPGGEQNGRFSNTNLGLSLGTGITWKWLIAGVEHRSALVRGQEDLRFRRTALPDETFNNTQVFLGARFRP